LFADAVKVEEQEMNNSIKEAVLCSSGEDSSDVWTS